MYRVFVSETGICGSDNQQDKKCAHALGFSNGRIKLADSGTYTRRGDWETLSDTATQLSRFTWPISIKRSLDPSVNSCAGARGVERRKSLWAILFSRPGRSESAAHPQSETIHSCATLDKRESILLASQPVNRLPISLRPHPVPPSESPRV